MMRAYNYWLTFCEYVSHYHLTISQTSNDNMYTIILLV